MPLNQVLIVRNLFVLSCLLCAVSALSEFSLLWAADVQGQECPFNHDFDPPRRMELCRYYMTGVCSKEKTCVYYHDIFLISSRPNFTR